MFARIVSVVVLVFALCIWDVKSTNLLGRYVNQDGVEYVYQLPGVKGVVGVVFLAHGCSHSSTDWWPQGSFCASCLGLPVELTLVRFALSLGYAVIAVSSSNRSHKCWMNTDRDRVSATLNIFYANNLQKDYSIPLYMVGASSGGAFVASLAQSNTLQAKVGAICVQINSARKPTAVPTLFVLMDRDEATLQDVREKAAAGFFAEHRVLLCRPKTVTPNYLFSMGAVRSEAASSAVHRALLRHGLLDRNTFFLLDDPRRSSWRQVPYCTILQLHLPSMRLSLSSTPTPPLPTGRP